MTKAAFAFAMTIVVSAISATSYGANFWNVNGTSCVADAGTIRDGLYLGTGGTVKFASGKTGDIVLYCPVSFKLDFKPSIVGLTYYDDSPSADHHVTVQLIKMAIDTGAITRLVTADSNRGPVSSGGKANHTAQEFTDTYDPKNFAYYLRIDVIRKSPTANVTVYSVSLLD
jgi:hypothetical protein